MARRTLFETRRDIRFFLACLARQVRTGDVEIHAYSVLTTHFHLLVRSPRGALSQAMQRALDAYARWFNRGRRRDGPLFRGRFTNRLVETESYWGNVVAYVDRNPVEAGLAARPSDYPHGSAFHYARASGPRWLRRDLVEKWVMGFAEGVPYDPARYRGLGGEGPGPAWLVERRLRAGHDGEGDPLDDLVGAAGPAVRSWMERKALLGDGTSPGWILVSPSAVGSCLEGRRRAWPGWGIDLDRRTRAGWETVQAGVLRWFCGLRVVEVAMTTGTPRSTAQDQAARFRRAFASSPDFRDRAAAVLADALAIDHGGARVCKGSSFWRHQNPSPGRFTGEKAHSVACVPSPG